MLEISNCPNSGLVRKTDYQFFWLKLNRKVIIQCHVSHFKRDMSAYTAYNTSYSAWTANPTGSTKPIANYDTLINNLAIKTFIKELVASDSLVNRTTGEILTTEQLNAYNNSVSAYNAYGSAFSLFQANTIVYNNYLTSLATYQSAYTAYTVSLSAWTENPVGEPPVAPIVPFVINEPIEPIEPPTPGPAPIQEYDFYAYVLGVTPIILPTLIEQTITARDSQGKFNV